MTSCARDPPGSGVSEIRMVSPMPSCSSTESAAVERDDSLGSHAGLGQAEVQRVIGAPRQLAIDGDEVLHARHLARQDDPVAGQPDLLGPGGGFERRSHHRMAHDRGRVERLGTLAVLVHDARQQVLVEAAPVDPDAHRLVVPAGQFDHLGELLVLFPAEADVARVDAVLGQCFGAGRVVGQQAMAVVMEIADQRHVAVQPVQVLADFRYGGAPPPAY